MEWFDLGNKPEEPLEIENLTDMFELLNEEPHEAEGLMGLDRRVQLRG